MSETQIHLECNMKINVYKIIDDAIENAVKRGYVRAHKHVDSPSESLMIQEIHRAVMNELCEIIKFDDE